MSDRRLHILSSGSKGNAFLVESGGVAILIDQGLPFRRFKERCERIGVSPEVAQAILVTHEHLDHINGVPLTARKLGIPVYASPAVIAYFSDLGATIPDLRGISPVDRLIIGPFAVEPFPVMHDARDPFGFTVIFSNSERLTIVTDTGMVTHRIFSQIAVSEYLVIEANHDPGLLYRNPHYPPELKQRIRGSHGHLSNEQCAEILERLPRGRLRKVIFAHLSEENNSPALVSHVTCESLNRCSFTGDFFIASQETPFSVDLS